MRHKNRSNSGKTKNSRNQPRTKQRNPVLGEAEVVPQVYMNDNDESSKDRDDQTDDVGHRRLLIHVYSTLINMLRADSTRPTTATQKLSAVVLTLTLLVIAWYSLETARLRIATEQQIKRSYLPIIVLEFTSRSLVDSDGNYDLHPTLRNVGFGPAFNIEVSGIANERSRIDFDQVPGLGREATAELRIEATSEDDDSMITFGKLLTNSPADKQLVFNSFPVTITYLDGRGERQQVFQEVQVQLQKREIVAIVKNMKSLESTGENKWFDSR
jgi:hypothetical protein